MSDLKKYIVLYSDLNLKIDEYIIKLIKEKYNIDIDIYQFLSLNQEKNRLNEIYYDNYYEEIMIKNCLFVIYLCSSQKTENLCDYLIKYNKYICSNIEDYLPLKNEIKEENKNEILKEISEEIIDEEIIEIQNKKVPLEFIYIYVEKIIKNLNSENIDLSFSCIENKKFQDYISEKMNEHKNYFLENYKNLENKNIEEDNKNISFINIKKNNIEMPDYKIYILTFYKSSDINILNVIQKKCILENLKNTYVEKVLVLGNNLNKEFEEFNENKKLILYNYSKNVSFKDLIDISNKVYKNKIICILRSDIILLNSSELDDLKFDLNNNNIYCLSRIERLISGNLTKCNKLNKIFYSTEQDSWIFKSPLNLSDDNLNFLENKYLYDSFSHLFLNKILYDNNYKIINDNTKYKIIRILYENNIDNRPLLNYNVKIEDSNDFYLLPDKNNIESIPFEHIIRMANLDNDEVYKLKCDIFDKYIKQKIFKF
jgi:hypothetical protein